jgi:hypothetical protein
MKTTRPWRIGFPFTLCLCTAFAWQQPLSAIAQEGELLTESGVIFGTMEIDFRTRTNKDTTGKYVDGSPALNAADEYTVDLKVAKTTEFAGKITRHPNIYSKTLHRLEQPAALGFDLNLSVLNPADLKQKRTVGKWVGKVPIDAATGAYDLSAGAKDERALRIAIDTVGAAKGFVDPFNGRLVGKAEKKENLASYTYTRLVGNRTVKIEVKKSDPMKFDNIEIAKGPSENYPRTRVTGRLDFDYETSNWYTDGIRFKYALNGKDFEDVITGSIKWVEDPNYKTNGKGQYEFNLRFNEDKHKSAKSESAAFEQMSAEDAFFVVDDSVPCLTGTIAYLDTFSHSSGDMPSASKVTFSLNANKLTKQQIMNFFKLWMLAVGPTNDE